MQIEIGRRLYTLTFGFDALDYLDKVYTQTEPQSGLEFGVGLRLFIPYLMMRNITALRHAIKAGTSTEMSKPSNFEIEEFIAKKLEDNTEVDFFDEIIDALKKQPLTKKRATEMVSAVEKETVEVETAPPTIG